jgi:hypothetical protein
MNMHCTFDGHQFKDQLGRPALMYVVELVAMRRKELD